MKKIIPLVIIIFLSLVSISANSQNPQKPILSNSSIKLINKKSIDNNNKPEKKDMGVASKNTNAKLKKENTLWRKRRQLFYGNVDANNMSVQFLTSFYKELFRNMGLITIFSNIIPRHNPHLDYFIFMLRKNENQHENSLKTLDWISLDPLFSRNQ